MKAVQTSWLLTFEVLYTCQNTQNVKDQPTKNKHQYLHLNEFSFIYFFKRVKQFNKLPTFGWNVPAGIVALRSCFHPRHGQGHQYPYLAQTSMFYPTLVTSFLCFPISALTFGVFCCVGLQTICHRKANLCSALWVISVSLSHLIESRALLSPPPLLRSCSRSSVSIESPTTYIEP